MIRWDDGALERRLQVVLDMLTQAAVVVREAHDYVVERGKDTDGEHTAGTVGQPDDVPDGP